MRTGWLLVLGAALAACGGSDDGFDADYIVFGSSASTVTVGWLADLNATAVVIERGRTEAELAVIATVAGSETSFLDTGLEPLTSYTYRLTIQSADGTSVVEPVEHTSTTSEQIVTTGPAPALGAPVVATVGLDGASVAVAAVSATVVVPPGAAADGTQLSIQPLGSPLGDDPDIGGLEVTADGELTQPVQVVFTFDDVDALAPDNLGIIMQADDGSWIAQPRAVDPDAGTVTVSLVPEAFAPLALWAGPRRARPVLLLRETHIEPRSATVKVNKTVMLTPMGHFTDEKECMNPGSSQAEETLCLSLAWAARSLAGMKQPVVETHPLANTAAGYERNWLVDGAINGSSAKGLISPLGGVGALYIAPGAAPSTRIIQVTFTSVRLPGRQSALTVPAKITIDDPGSIRVTARMNGGTDFPSCPFGSATISDEVSFSLTLDAQLEYVVTAIANDATMIGPLTPSSSYSSAGWDSDPEMFTMSAGAGFDDITGQFIVVDIAGTSTAGNCWGVDASNGMTYHAAGFPDNDNHEFLIYLDLHVETEDPYWSATAEYIETP